MNGRDSSVLHSREERHWHLAMGPPPHVCERGGGRKEASALTMGGDAVCLPAHQGPPWQGRLPLSSVVLVHALIHS